MVCALGYPIQTSSEHIPLEIHAKSIKQCSKIHRITSFEDGIKMKISAYTKQPVTPKWTEIIFFFFKFSYPDSLNGVGVSKNGLGLTPHFLASIYRAAS